ncbi:hypothetical protein BDN72DRAFT_846281 [Pluteus cervinus]|uniref:Uncharacterized protein n=1 Tax=Pluteus cervinus TaxID=181527 RepID=A0ACD3AG90_9AGAR|nr:hypothetical protein BDN72DRAFT_846281 [Pluteus cervinus]
MFAALPSEVINHILSWVGSGRDLLNFACVSRVCKALVIPNHLEYRVVRVAAGVDWQQDVNPGCVDIWKHLTHRYDLTSNIRTLHFIMEYFVDDYHGFRIPTQLVEKLDEAQTPRPPELEEAEDDSQFRAICAAIVKMEKLETFMWDVGREEAAISGENDLLLELVTQKSTLRKLRLANECAVRGLLESLKNPRHSIWRMSHLKALIIGYAWSFRTEVFEPFVVQDKYFAPWIQSLSSLTFLRINVEVFAAHSGKFHLPVLKGLSLVGYRATSPASNDHMATFLLNHPQIEEFSWTPWAAVQITLAPGCLPNVRRLTCPPEFLWALDSTIWGFGPFNTPRKIEELNLTGGCRSKTRLENLLSSRSFDHLSIKCLRVHSPVAESFDPLFALPKNFRTLGIPHNQDFEWISQHQWVRLLSKFGNLEVFNGDGIWGKTFDDIPEASDPEVVQVVQKFARRCPKLRQILCPVDLPDKSIQQQNQKLRIWREDARSHGGARIMAKWLGINDDEMKNWVVRWEFVESVLVDPFDTMDYDEMD